MIFLSCNSIKIVLYKAQQFKENTNMSRIINPMILQCPSCKSSINKSDNLFICKSCNTSYKIEEECYYFCNYAKSDIVDGLDYLKFFLKKFRNFYSFLINIISPVCPSWELKKFIKKEVTESQVAINFGSGNSDLSKNISNVDLFRYEKVNMCCDISNIPIKDNQVDIIINIAVLEHVPDPEKIISEFKRVLKPGGKIFCYFPFIQGFHASPYDYSRRTIEGIKWLFKDFEIEKIKSNGPTSGFLWVFQEWLAILLSFGIKHLYSLLYIVIMLLTFPIKFLDLLLKHHPTGHHISTGFTIIAKKK